MESVLPTFNVHFENRNKFKNAEKQNPLELINKKGALFIKTPHGSIFWQGHSFKIWQKKLLHMSLFFA